MKLSKGKERIVLCLVLIGVVYLPLGCQSPTWGGASILTGRWEGERILNFGNVVTDLTFELLQDGSRVEGSVSYTGLNWEIRNGRYENNELTFDLQTGSHYLLWRLKLYHRDILSGTFYSPYAADLDGRFWGIRK